MAENCGCGGDTTLIFPCSGGSDVGEVSDRVARRLGSEGLGKMSCLAGIGAGMSGFIASAQGASKVLLIDGCPVDCARKGMEKAGVTGFIHLRLTDTGLAKGKSPANETNVGTAYAKARELIG